MNLEDISTQLLYTTVPIWIDQGGGKVSSGTGFIYNHQSKEAPQESIPFLITNFHVVSGGKGGMLEFVEREGELPAKGKRVRMQIDKPFLDSRLGDKNVDLVAFPIAPAFRQLELAGKKIFFRSVSNEILPSKAVVDDLSALEEITFIGYPSGIFDEHNSSPVVRRGITATPIWNDFKGEPCFLIDAGVFPGSSGSPVFLLNQGSYATRSGLTIGTRLYFLGVISESFIHVAEKDNKSFLGLGKVINSIRFGSYIESVLNELRSQGKLS
jgi:hypothetical protein